WALTTHGEGAAADDKGKGGEKSLEDTSQATGCVERSLFSLGVRGSGVLTWGRIMACSGMLPQSTCLRHMFQGERGGRDRGSGGSRCGMGVASHVTVGIEMGAGVDDKQLPPCRVVHLVVAPLLAIGHTEQGPAEVNPTNNQRGGCTEAYSRRKTRTLWRLLGTISSLAACPEDILGPGAVTGAGGRVRGDTVVMREDATDRCRGARAKSSSMQSPWGALLSFLLGEGLFGVMALPAFLFNTDAGGGTG
ncbi:unnamed protein product, partial [Discosporangium mesarthrocarpum]